jgi:hypothetical protein
MEIKITIDEDKIACLVEELIAEQMVSKYASMQRDAKCGVRQGVEKAVKSYVYSQKDDIIERCVKRASAELVRKGLPKLLEVAVKEHDQGGQA